MNTFSAIAAETLATLDRHPRGLETWSSPGTTGNRRSYGLRLETALILRDLSGDIAHVAMLKAPPRTPHPYPSS
jgi:hypothetical protein